MLIFLVIIYLISFFPLSTKPYFSCFHYITNELSIQVESFGFKHGVPYDADFVFDVRCLPNPYWDLALRSLNGKDQGVVEFLQEHPITVSMQDDILNFLRNRIPEYTEHNRNYLTVAIGCTGGQHRSVYLAEAVAAELGKIHDKVLVRHTQLSLTAD